MIRKDDLQRDGLILFQDTELPCFTQDSVLLAHFLNLSKKDSAVDLGSGTGVLCVLGKALTGASFTGVELNAQTAALAARSEEENRQGIRYECMNVSEAPAFFGHGSFSAAVMNPPYFGAGPESPDATRAAARHGSGNALSVFLHAAFLLLSNGGKLFLCCPADRLADVFFLLRTERLEPKRMRLVARGAGSAPRLALIEAKKLGHPGLNMEPVLFENG